MAGGCTVDDPTLLVSGVMMGGVSTTLSLPSPKPRQDSSCCLRITISCAARRHSRPRTLALVTVNATSVRSAPNCARVTSWAIRSNRIRVMRTLLMTGEAKQRGSLWAQYCCECNVCSLIACPEPLDPKNICVDAKALLACQQAGTHARTNSNSCSRPRIPARTARNPDQDALHAIGTDPVRPKAPFVERTGNRASRRFPLNTHIGQPARPIVSVGDAVTAARLIATVDDDKLGCPVHASVAGQVKSVSPTHIEITTNK